MCYRRARGQQTLAGRSNTWVLNPQSASSYVDSFILRVAAEYFPSGGSALGVVGASSGTDNYLGDPTIGIPTRAAALGMAALAPQQHDTPPSWIKSLHQLTVMNATYAYFIASARPAEKRWLAEVALNERLRSERRGHGTILDEIAATEAADRLAVCSIRATRKLTTRPRRLRRRPFGGSQGEWTSV